MFQHITCGTASPTQSFCVKWVCPKLDMPADGYKHCLACILVHSMLLTDEINSPGGMLWFLKQYLHNKKNYRIFPLQPYIYKLQSCVALLI